MFVQSRITELKRIISGFRVKCVKGDDGNLPLMEMLEKVFKKV